jgi:hypothetical protein
MLEQRPGGDEGDSDWHGVSQALNSNPSPLRVGGTANSGTPLRPTRLMK